MQIVTVVIDLITDKKHTHFVKAVDDLNPNSGNDKYGLEAAWECMGDDHDRARSSHRCVCQCRCQCKSLHHKL